MGNYKLGERGMNSHKKDILLITDNWSFFKGTPIQYKNEPIQKC